MVQMFANIFQSCLYFFNVMRFFFMVLFTWCRANIMI